jgi:ribosome biogenesis SPOUT family RNA methylase Rps3
MPKPTYIIEHLEPMLGKWCLIEYEHISKIVGKRNLWFTNIKRKSTQLEKLGKTFRQSVSKMNLKRVCVLDLESNTLLSPKDSKKFDYFIFGGILGDNPPKKRTKKELTRFLQGAQVRNIGKKQMSTDNAIFTVHEIIENKRNFKNLPLKDKIEIQIGKFDSVILPYRYNLVNNKPLISLKLITYLKRKKGI